MIKILISLMLCFTLTGCMQQKQPSIYDEMIMDINDHQDYKTSSEAFNISLYVNKLEENRYQYDIIINDAKIKMNDVRTIVVCENDNGYINPSFGFEEGEHCHLYPNYIDQTNHYYDGIRLSGISTSKEVTCKVYITYHSNQKLIEEYIMLKG